MTYLIIAAFFSASMRVSMSKACSRKDVLKQIEQAELLFPPITYHHRKAINYNINEENIRKVQIKSLMCV